MRTIGSMRAKIAMRTLTSIITFLPNKRSVIAREMTKLCVIVRKWRLTTAAKHTKTLPVFVYVIVSIYICLQNILVMWLLQTFVKAIIYSPNVPGTFPKKMNQIQITICTGDNRFSALSLIGNTISKKHIGDTKQMKTISHQFPPASLIRRHRRTDKENVMLIDWTKKEKKKQSIPPTNRPTN